MNKPRRHFSGPEKVAILKRHLLEKTPVSNLCDEFGIAPNLFYRWQKEFFENGHSAFDTDRKAKAIADAKALRLSLTATRQYNITDHATPTRFGIYYGWLTARPEFAVRATS